jgi:predicted extracellular nuclease
MNSSRSRVTRTAGACLAALTLGLFVPATPSGVSPNIVISQIYGGGGNSGAPYTHDFVELFNRGTVPVSLGGWSLQYASATGTGSFGANSGQLTELPDVTLQPGQYFLVQQAGGSTGVALPTADFVDASPISMAGAAGKVALVTGIATLGCNGGSSVCDATALARIIDLVGYGNANFFEGAAAPTLSNMTAARRAGGGCTDTDVNSADFAAAAPSPRNSGSSFNPCGGPPPTPRVSVADIAFFEGNAGATSATFTVSLTSPAPASGVSFTYATADGTASSSSDYAAAAGSGVIAAGALSAQFSITVHGDTDVEPDESFSVQLSDVAGADVADAAATATIRNDDYLAAAIHTIQGDGLVSPLTGTPVVTTGIVTGIKGNGFFMQSAGEGDGDPLTSEGLFIFTSTLPTVKPGDLAEVRGTATEFFDLTQVVASTGSVNIVSSGNALPAAVQLTTTILAPQGTASQLERFEGMRMQGTVVSVAPTNEFGEIYTVLTGVTRPRREPGIEAGLPQPPDPETGLLDCCVPFWDRNPERLMIDTDGLAGATALQVTSLVAMSLVGPLDYTFGDYKVLPTEPLMPSAGLTAAAVPAPADNQFTISGYNIENFTGAVTQRRKAALNIRTVMQSPDIIGVVEIASKAALQSLADQVNADTLAAGGTDPGYVAELIPFGTNNQHVGFLVKTSRVQITRVTQALADDIFINPGTGQSELLHDRPPLVLEAIVEPRGQHPTPVVVVVNHLRSFIGIEAVDGDGPRVRAKRQAQAEAIARLLQDLQTLNRATPVVAVGDYNAYEFSDGYTDPISVLKGVPTPGDQIVVGSSPDLVEPDFRNLTDWLPADERYTFIFEGTPQALDHVLVNPIAHAFLEHYAIARSNADFPSQAAAGLVNDPTRPEANSDHDATVAYFRIKGKVNGQGKK